MDNKYLIMGLLAISNVENVTPPIFLDDGYNQEVTDGNREFLTPVTFESEFNRLAGRINDFQQVQDNWDGFGALKPLSDTIANAKLVLENVPDKFLKLLNTDDLSLTPYGTVVLDFEDNANNELSIEIGKDEIGLCGDIQGEEIIINSIPFYDFGNVIDNHIKKLSFKA